MYKKFIPEEIGLKKDFHLTKFTKVFLFFILFLLLIREKDEGVNYHKINCSDT